MSRNHFYILLIVFRGAKREILEVFSGVVMGVRKFIFVKVSCKKFVRVFFSIFKKQIFIKTKNPKKKNWINQGIGRKGEGRRYKFINICWYFRLFCLFSGNNTSSVTHIEKRIWLLVMRISNILHIHEQHKRYFHIDICLRGWRGSAGRILLHEVVRRFYIN